MFLRRRRDEALAAAVDAEDKLEAAEQAHDEAVEARKAHDLQASSMPPEGWNTKAREVDAAVSTTARFLGVVRERRDAALESFAAAHIAYEQQGLFTDCRAYNERMLDVARLAEEFEAALQALTAAAPGNDSSLRRMLNDQLVRLLSSIGSRTTGAAFATVRSTDARAFAVEMMIEPSDTMFRRVSYLTEHSLADHWVKCRSTNPARYAFERGRRKLGGKGGLAVEEADQS
jgi:hypothetical protein